MKVEHVAYTLRVERPARMSQNRSERVEDAIADHFGTRLQDFTLSIDNAWYMTLYTADDATITTDSATIQRLVKETK